MKTILLILAFAAGALAQNPTPFRVVSADPTGTACGSTSVALLVPNGTLYTCQSGAYAAISGGGGGGSPTGAAGGLLSGTYPNPGLGAVDCAVTFSGPAATTTATWPAAAGCTSFSYAPPNGTTAVTINSPSAGPVLTNSAPMLTINFTQPASGGTLTSVTAPSEFVNTPFNSNTIPQEPGKILSFRVQLVGSNLRGQSAINDTGHGIGACTTAPSANPQSGQNYPWCSTADGGDAEWTGPTGSLFKGFLSGVDADPVTGKLSTVNKRRVCQYDVGADNAAAVIVDADLGPQKAVCKVPFAATVAEIDVNADAGTPSVILAVLHCTAFTANKCSATSTTNLLSGALAATTGGFDYCSNTGGTAGIDTGTTCAATLQNTSIAAGDYISLVSGTAGGTAKRMSISVVYTVN